MITVAIAVVLLAGAPRALAAEAAPASGVVLFSDAGWGRLILHDGARVVAIDSTARGLRELPPPGRRVEIDAGSRLRDLGAGVWPEPLPLPSALPTGGPPLWVALEATVRVVVRAEDGRGFLRVSAAGLPLDVHVPAAPPPGSAVQVGARLRLAGALEPPSRPWDAARIWVPSWSEVAVTAAALPWENVPRVSVEEARALARGAREGEIRVVGRAVARPTRRLVRIEQDGHEIVTELERSEAVREGSTIEVRGFAGTRRGQPVMLDARWRGAGVPASHVSRREPGLPLLTRVAAVRALPRAEAERGYPVRLTAVLTYVGPLHGQLFLQDETGGLFARFERVPAGVFAGDLVAVEGHTAAGGLAPTLVEPRVRRLARGRMPAAQPVSAARLATGYDDCRRIETTGVVRRVRRLDAETELLLGVEGQRLTVQMPLRLADPAIAPDARVRVRAVCGTHYNWRGLLDQVMLFAASPEDVEVQEPATDPSALPLVSVGSLLRSDLGGRWERLVRSRGTVLHQEPGQALYLRSTAGTFVAESDLLQPVAPGDEVEVAGFPAAGSGAPRLLNASFRRLASGPAPQPLPLHGIPFVGPDLDAELARFDGRLLELVRHDAGTSLLLQTGDRVVEASGHGDLDPEPPEGSLLEVTGILLPQVVVPGRDSDVHVVLRSPSDVRLLGRAPWLTPRRAGWALGGLALASSVALVWVATLRRQVRARTARLRAAEQRYRLLADNASDVIVTADTQLRLTYVSPSIEVRSGYSVEEALATPLERLLTPDSWQRLHSARERALERDGPGLEELDLELLRKDGARRWLHVRAAALRDAAGTVTGYLASARDVTARRRAQQELARLGAAIEQSADAVLLTDPEARIVYVNRAFERVTGYAAAEVLGGTPAVLKSGAHGRGFYEALWATLRDGRTWEGRFRNRRKDGTLFTEDASIAPVRDPADGRLVGYVAVKRDVTRQVELEARLAQAQKMEAVGRLSAGIAHDFNNVLAIILSLADVLQKRPGGDERSAACIAGIRDAALRAGGLTRQILTFSRQSPPATETVEPTATVAEAVRMLRMLVPQRVEVREALHSTLRLAADPTQLHQLVLNLGTNAGLAMRELGGVVEVTLEDAWVDAAFAERHPPLAEGPCLRLAVRDQGCGMAAETVSRIFEPFFTTRLARDGTGMGLAVVHGIVQNHCGAITVDSAPGRGSTFTVYLPALPPAGQEVSRGRSSDSGPAPA